MGKGGKNEREKMEETEERNGREKKCERKGKMEEEDREETRPDTRPSVAYGWAGAVMLKNQRKLYFTKA